MKTGGQASQNMYIYHVNPCRHCKDCSCIANRGIFLIDWRLSVIDRYVSVNQTSSRAARRYGTGD